jgi:hypothetical protein
VDIYDAECQEVLVSSDAIQVKAQKPTRQRPQSAQEEEEEDTLAKENKKVVKKRINTDLMLIEGQDGSYRHLMAGVVGEERVSLLEVARAYL